MMRAQILGIGAYVPDRVVTNDELRFLNDQHVRQASPTIETNDEWIQVRTGIKERRYVPNDRSMGTSDMALRAARQALDEAGCAPQEVDCIIFATLSPDIHFPGTAVFLQDKLGIAGESKGRSCACYDIRQQCSGFVYGLQMADAFIRTGLYRRILLVGAETHSHALDFTTRGRDVTVLFGDGAGVFLLGPQETDDPRAGILYTDCRADGTGAWNLCLPIFDIRHLPYLSYDPKNPDENKPMYPHMDGKRVFLHAVRNMVMSAQQALAATGLTWDDIDWFVPHQANLRINEKVVEVARIPPAKALNTIQFYGNTTAATVPLTIEHWRREGKVKKGDRVLSTVFGAGFTWGSAIFQI
jgi:3-oxoacyl-[acyl-carrier-protein] synthase III